MLKSATLLVSTLMLSGFALAGAAGCQPGSRSAPAGSDPNNPTPLAVLEWTSRGGGFRDWGCDGKYLYAALVKPFTLEVWQWRDQTLQQCRDFGLEDCLTPIWAQDEVCYFYRVLKYDNNDFVSRVDVGRGTPESRLPIPRGWWCRRLQASASGRYVGVYLEEDSGQGSSGNQDRARVGIIDPQAGEIEWLSMLVGKWMTACTNVTDVLPSDDGTYVAIGGWDNGVVLIDRATRTVLWTKGLPAGEASLPYVAFAPHNERLYAGGTSGVVWTLDLQTGAEHKTWVASPTGREEYGHRITCLAASPDGRWVAAGTGPEGLVFLGSTATGQVVRTFDHGKGGVLVASFAPDSSALATFVPGSIKIWAMPPTDAAASQPTTNESATSRPTASAPATSQPTTRGTPPPASTRLLRD